MLGIQLGRKRQGTPGDSIKTVDSDSLILGSPLLKENLNRNLNRNSLLFYVLWEYIMDYVFYALCYSMYYEKLLKSFIGTVHNG